MRRIVIATNNKKKKRELEKILKSLKVKVMNLDDTGIHVPLVIEDGKTFRQNAIKKALIFSHYIKELILADDSGLVVKALGGKPGVRSARFAHTKATDKENNEKLLKLMRNIPMKKRQATFISVVAIAENGDLVGISEGRCPGSIGFKSKGKNGFGYDPIFTPKGHNRTFAELTQAFKNRISHRAKALRGAKPVIQKYL